jgi:hypothetical protein
MNGPVKERTIRVGRPTPLAGVSSEPSVFDATKPAMLILNSGVLHHIGSCRMSVRLAREVAAQGLLAVRFDYSGIGDSEPRLASPDFDEVSVTECAEVMDFLQRTRGVNTFILYGLCSGADGAYNTALRDARVVGISQFDPYCYVTPKYYARYYLHAARDPQRWRSVATRLLRSLVRRTEVSRAEIDPEFVEIPSYVRVFPPRNAVAAGLGELVKRGVHVQANFPRGPLYNYPAQFAESFRDVDFRDLLEVNYYPAANHIVTQPAVQKRVINDIANWAVRVASAGRR